MSEKKEVAILGGGVAGLSAAHELVKKGFKVKVYEHKGIPGGKARSMPVPGSGKDGRKDLPGEHGFRFFPKFYQHLPATFKEIPLGNGKTVYDNLVQTTRIRIARYDEESIIMSSRFPKTIKDLKILLDNVFDTKYGLEPGETELFKDKIWQLMTSCKERRLDEYERISWWDFIEAEGKSEAYKSLLAEGLTRTLVATKARLASSKTGGDVLLQLIFDIAEPGLSSDMVLNAPTNEAWIDPWIKFLRTSYPENFEYHLNWELDQFICDGPNKKIDHLLLRKLTRNAHGKITSRGEAEKIRADYYISAVPVEVFAKKISPELLALDPSFKGILQLAHNVNWMNGIQFYLNQDVTINHGHCIYVNSEWALTSISQLQFWPDFDADKYGNGKIKGILSIDISNWFKKGLFNKEEASNCSREEIKEEVWAQLKKSLNVNGELLLKDEYLEDWFIDPSIVAPMLENRNEEEENINHEPLLVNRVNTWNLRPTAHTQIENLMLASDYVQTNTDLATMEGANEAARRAVNAIIHHSGVKQTYCKIWDLHEPNVLAIWRWADKEKFKKGIPWDGKISFLKRFFIWIKVWFSKHF